MKIHHLSDQPASAALAAPSKLAGRSAPAAAPASPAADAPATGASVQVQLSSATQSMVASSRSSGSSAVFNADKVQAMRDAIENGSFRANPGAIADKMLANARDLWRTSRSN
ncbi:MAG: flagellar biosynthesis anti-sigma factor FlgM [Macromonas bipunctata]|jgi:negative regulator of flagellin synthesis FlgM|uniref:flagellar biosynthesis anti-sigma factor FlgM n=1 Tax=Macromonas bipunctata TaxID=183670 RepID=UPI000C31F97F|nr:flagellar biosynthesis anti-sigma factor FlgM [Macromonas bipunctata]MDD2536146.1 flagellar biosynthesis anti-sigma factor FlgM [Macromonas bipunctata]